MIAKVLCVRHGDRMDKSGKKLSGLSPLGIAQVKAAARKFGGRLNKSTIYDAVHTCTERTQQTGEVFLPEMGINPTMLRGEDDFSSERPIRGAAGKLFGSYEPIERKLLAEYGGCPVPIMEWFLLYPPTHGSAERYFIAMRHWVERVATKVPSVIGEFGLLLFSHAATFELLALEFAPDMPYVSEFAGGVLYTWDVPISSGRAKLLGAERLYGPTEEEVSGYYDYSAASV